VSDIMSELKQNSSLGYMELKNDVKRLKKNQTKICIVFVASIFSMLLILYTNTVTIAEQDDIELRSKYVIEPLRGDTVDLYKLWKLVEDQKLHVKIVNEANVSEEKLDLVKDAIMSKESVVISDLAFHKGPSDSFSTYYKGWKGVLEQASLHDTKYFIPTEFEIHENTHGGDIIIELSRQKDVSGFTGFTKSITRDNQILKSEITIYDVNNLEDEQLVTIIRHEMGHAIGLAHSTAPEDLMYPSIQSDHRYISECDIDAITELYAERQTSQVVCEK